MKCVTLIKSISLGAVLCSSLYGTPNIPANCLTPGSCAELTPALKKVTLKESVSLADADASHTATIKAAANTIENVVITLPPVNGQPNQILATDANGSLIWKSEPSSADRLLGMIGFMIPDNARGIYELNGQTINDAKLAVYITAHPITGFDVSGNNVKLPDWRGRFVGASDGYTISSKAGTTGADKTAVNGLAFGMTVVNNETNSQTGHIVYQGNGGQQNYWSHTGNGSYSLRMLGDTETMPNWVGMPMVIVGGSK